MTSSTPAIISYLRSLEAVRDRSQKVFDLAIKGELDHWAWQEDKLADVVNYCAKLIEVGLRLCLSGERRMIYHS